ncbi:hypothetical protein AB6Q56_11165 [Dechloromonas sp. ARDL1]|uniref:hypothetical protein n=1 Tax=Dechloromonas sp. ARDL1 TaxID=3322121 RepID=UPI003DA7982B
MHEKQNGAEKICAIFLPKIQLEKGFSTASTFSSLLLFEKTRYRSRGLARQSYQPVLLLEGLLAPKALFQPRGTALSRCIGWIVSSGITFR